MAMTEVQLEECQILINNMPSGEYQIEDIYGEFNKENGDPRVFGKKFKKAVEDGKLENIELGRIDPGDKHWRYNLNGFLPD
ncbi:hypothetical protein A8B75_18780 [Sphingomonadales bacterium EhC05]|nr:hypothetical protein A8B75_18780 [Sphingomonadales bacterium EhC05]